MWFLLRREFILPIPFILVVLKAGEEGKGLIRLSKKVFEVFYDIYFC
jgi:hypothetical protein